MGKLNEVFDAESVDYVTSKRLAEAHGLRAMAGDGALRPAAQRYLEAVVGLFAAIRLEEAKRAREAARAHE